MWAMPLEMSLKTFNRTSFINCHLKYHFLKCHMQCHVNVISKNDDDTNHDLTDSFRHICQMSQKPIFFLVNIKYQLVGGFYHFLSVTLVRLLAKNK